MGSSLWPDLDTLKVVGYLLPDPRDIDSYEGYETAAATGKMTGVQVSDFFPVQMADSRMFPTTIKKAKSTRLSECRPAAVRFTWARSTSMRAHSRARRLRKRVRGAQPRASDDLARRRALRESRDRVRRVSDVSLSSGNRVRQFKAEYRPQSSPTCAYTCIRATQLTYGRRIFAIRGARVTKHRCIWSVSPPPEK